MTAPDELPNDIAELKAIIRAQQDQNARLEALVASFKKALFGSKSEKIDPAQYELELEDIETAIAQVAAEIDADARTAPVRAPKPRQTNRGSLPKHLERVEVVIEPELSCGCGAERHVIGEDGEPCGRHWFETQGERTVRHHPRPVPRDRHTASQIRLPVVRRWDHSGSCTRPHYRGRYANRSNARPCARLKICGSLAALSAGANLQPPRDRSGSLDLGGVGW